MSVFFQRIFMYLFVHLVSSNLVDIIVRHFNICLRKGNNQLQCQWFIESQVINFVLPYFIGILFSETHPFLLFQTRGSIPLYWTQRPNLKYMPLPSLRPLNHVRSAFLLSYLLVYKIEFVVQVSDFSVKQFIYIKFKPSVITTNILLNVQK